MWYENGIPLSSIQCSNYSVVYMYNEPPFYVSKPIRQIKVFSNGSITVNNVFLPISGISKRFPSMQYGFMLGYTNIGVSILLNNSYYTLSANGTDFYFGSESDSLFVLSNEDGIFHDGVRLYPTNSKASSASAKSVFLSIVVTIFITTFIL